MRFYARFACGNPHFHTSWYKISLKKREAYATLSNYWMRTIHTMCRTASSDTSGLVARCVFQLVARCATYARKYLISFDLTETPTYCKKNFVIEIKRKNTVFFSIDSSWGRVSKTYVNNKLFLLLRTLQKNIFFSHHIWYGGVRHENLWQRRMHSRDRLRRIIGIRRKKNNEGKLCARKFQ